MPDKLPADDPNFIDKLIAQVDAEEAELKMLRNFHNEVSAALASEHAGDIEHLIAAATLGKHTTVIGRKRLEQLHQAETDLPMWRRFASYCRCCAQSGQSDPDDFDTFKTRMALVPTTTGHTGEEASNEPTGERKFLQEWQQDFPSAPPPADVPSSPTFEEAWAVKESEGYQYGSDALEQVRLGWNLRESYIKDAPAPSLTSEPLLDLSKIANHTLVLELATRLRDGRMEVPKQVDGEVVDADKIDALECTLDDEEAAHQDTLRLLEAAEQRAADAEAKLEGGKVE